MNIQTVPALREQLRRSDSYNRLEIILDLYGRIPESWWFRELGRNWSTCDNLGSFRRPLSAILSRAGRDNLGRMMTDAEARRWRELPASVVAYRGCEYSDRYGFSYSLNRDVALKFACSYIRYKAKKPALRTVEIPRENCIIKLDRNEDEIILCRRSGSKVLLIERPSPQTL